MCLDPRSFAGIDAPFPCGRGESRGGDVGVRCLPSQRWKAVRCACPLTFFCASCGQPLLLEGEPSPGLRVSCPTCRSIVDVPLPAGDEPLEVSWFAMVRGSQVGPMALDPLGQVIRVGEVTGKTFVWCEGMAEWRRAETLPDLMPLLRATQAPRPANTADLSQLFS